MKMVSAVLILLVIAGFNSSLLAYAIDTTQQGTVPKYSFDSLVEAKRPFIEIVAGNSSFSFNNDAGFQKDLSIGAVLGFYSNKKLFQSDVKSTSLGALYVTYIRAGDTAAGKASVNTWQFGLQNTEVYSLPLSNNNALAIDFGITRSPLSWFAQSFPALGSDSTTAAQLRGRFDGTRFGEATRASIGLRVADPVSINAGFEWGQAYERHLVWYWAMSGIIEGIADGVGSYFVKAVGKSSPIAAPIVHFIVRNGIAMGFKALRQNQMNWPFTTAAPLNYYTYSVGVTVRM